jgi:UDP-4-amino-4-deoxy-L-arabinose-oxoglutarate aminotransferase
MLAQGERVRVFERQVSDWVGARGGVATGCGASALGLAIQALEIGAHDEVVVPSYVCRSVLEAVFAQNATAVLCDVGPDWTLTVGTVEPVLSGRTKAIIAPHMYGIFADIAGLKDLGVPVIEDCAQAIAGNGDRDIAGTIAVFSFHPTKCFTTGEGGMAVASEPAVVDRMRRLRDGDACAGSRRLFSPMSEMAAGLGISQLARYGEILRKRKNIASKYYDALTAAAPWVVNARALRDSMFFRFPVVVKGGVDSYARTFEQRGIIVRRGVDELLHRLIGHPDEDFPMSVQHYERTVSIPIYPAMSDEQIENCRIGLEEILGQSRKEK